VKREKEVECKVKLSYNEQDIQKIGDINYLTRLNIVCFPKQINVSYQIQSSYRSTNHVADSSFYFECNTDRGIIDQLYIELGMQSAFRHIFKEQVKQ
jgi:hypothetical protein